MIPALALLAACGTDATGPRPDPAVDPQPPALEPPPATDPAPSFENEAMASVPLLGGTMAPVQALGRVVAADPAGDRLLVAGLDAEVDEIALGANARPFRIHVEDTFAFVTLRGTGELAKVDVDRGVVSWRTKVCPEPRGVTRSPSGKLVVACAGGELVEVAASGAVVRQALLEADLRDVVASGATLYVSRFRAAEVLSVDPDTFEVDETVGVEPQVGQVAWRMKEDYRGGVTVSYQRTSDTVIGREPDTVEEEEPPSPYGSSEPTPLVCGGLHDSSFGRVGANDAAVLGKALKDVLLPVDWVVLDDGRVVVLNGGTGPSSARGGITVFPSYDDLTGSVACVDPDVDLRLPTEGQPAALARLDDTLFVQTANPTTVWRVDTAGTALLFEDTAADEGMTIFHRDTGNAIACAACHPEGTDDGHVWKFDDTLAGVAFEGERKTLPLAGGISQRAPFHWAGELPTEDDLVQSTLVEGMGGEALAEEQVGALFAWLDGLRAVRANPGATPDELAAGRAIFVARGCGSCHSGEQHADNALHTVLVLSEPTKTPSLVGLGMRESLMHDGCASSIEERLTGDPVCTGGNDHGDLHDLFPEDADLLAKYLRSL